MKRRTRMVWAMGVLAGASLFAADNLITNGDFESGFATDQGWGGYASTGDKYSNPGWDVDPTNRVGLGKPDGTWAAKGLPLGSYCLFIQTQGTEASKAWQDFTVPEDGTYLVAFDWGARPSYAGITTVVTVGGQTIGQLATSDAALHKFSQTVQLTAGTQRLQFEETGNGKDVANWFDNISISAKPAAAYIGTQPYDSFAAAMSAAKAGDVIVYSETGDGNATLAAGTIDWNATMPSVKVEGTLKLNGAVTLAVVPPVMGTYTLFEASTIDTTAGSFQLPAPANDVTTYTLNVTASAVTLTVARNLDATERVGNGSFDDSGTWIGEGSGTKLGMWGYSYAANFCLPGWIVGGGGTDSGVGLAVQNSDWVGGNQTNGGTYSYFAQGHGKALVQDFTAPTPAGIYTLAYSRAGRPSHGSSFWRVGLRRDGETVYSYQTEPNNNTVLAAETTVVSLPQAGAWGLAFTHDHPDTGDRAAILDDVSFRRVPVEGWSLDGAVTRLATGAKVPVGAYVAGDAAIAANATVTFATAAKTPALNVGGTLRLEGPVTITAVDTLALSEGDYRLVKADAIEYASGASFVLDPTLVFRNPTDSSANYNYRAELTVDETSVTLRIRNYDLTGTNNYRLPADALSEGLYADPTLWTRGHVPNGTDGNVILNDGCNISFATAEANLTLKPWYVRNDFSKPVILSAATPEAGFAFKGSVNVGCGDAGTRGWINFASGTYELTTIYAPSINGGGGNAECRVEFTGADVTFAKGGCLQCNWASGSRTELTVSAGTVFIDHDFNANIVGNTYHKFRMSGGTFEVKNFQVYSCLSTFDGEMTGGELWTRGNFGLGNSGHRDALYSFRLKGGRLRADNFTIGAGEGATATFLVDGGVLAPWAGSATWANGMTFTVAKGGMLRLDSLDLDATWCATTVDEEGGDDFGIAKEGVGTVRFAAAPTAEGPVEVKAGALVFPAGTVLKGALAAAAGTVVAVEPAEGAELAEGDVILTAEGGITLAPTTAVIVSGGSATLSADGKQLLYAAADTTPVVAVWVGGGDRANAADPANWSCQNASGATLDGAVPGALTKITVTGPTSFNLPAGQLLTCASLELKDVVLTADCDWRGLSLARISEGTIDLAGHSLALAGFNGDTPTALTITDSTVAESVVLNGDFSDSTVTGNSGAWSYGTAGATSANWTLGSKAGIAKAGSPWTGSVISEPYAAYIQQDSAEAYLKQTFNVSTAGRYRLGFWYVPRQAMPSGEGANILIDGVHKGSVFTPGNVWVPAAFELDLTAGSHEILFQGNNSGSTADRSIVFDDITMTRIDGYGRLIVDVPENALLNNNKIALAGNLTLVKEGAGTLQAAVARQDYRGGTEVAAGMLRSAVGGNANWPFGARRSAITVAEGATFDDNGQWDVSFYDIVLAGGTLANFGGNLASNGETGRFGWGALGDVTLTGDAKLVATGNVLFHGYSDNGIDLGGHTLTATTGRNYIFLGEPLANGTFTVASDETMLWTTAEIDASTVDFDLACRLEIYNPITVRDLTLRNVTPHGWSSALVKVKGTFSPLADTFCDTELENGATLNLAMKTEPWSLKSLDASATVKIEGTETPKPYLATFADDATITVDVGQRRLFSQVPVIAWDAETKPANLATLKFQLQAGRKGTLIAKEDGLYFYSGLAVFIR